MSVFLAALVVASLAASPVQILFHCDPDPLMTGPNKFQVMVSDKAGKRVTSATIEVELSNSDVPSLHRAVELKHYGDGIYRGTAGLAAPGRWTIVIVVRRNGEVVGTRVLTRQVR